MRPSSKVVTRSSAGKLTETLVRVTDPVSWALIKNIEGLGGGNSNIFTPIWGRWTHFDEHIFQLGWFNHQLGDVFFFFSGLTLGWMSSYFFFGRCIANFRILSMVLFRKMFQKWNQEDLTNKQAGCHKWSWDIGYVIWAVCSVSFVV